MPAARTMTPPKTKMMTAATTTTSACPSPMTPILALPAPTPTAPAADGSRFAQVLDKVNDICLVLYIVEVGALVGFEIALLLRSSFSLLSPPQPPTQTTLILSYALSFLAKSCCFYCIVADCWLLPGLSETAAWLYVILRAFLHYGACNTVLLLHVCGFHLFPASLSGFISDSSFAVTPSMASGICSTW